MRLRSNVERKKFSNSLISADIKIQQSLENHEEKNDQTELVIIKAQKKKKISKNKMSLKKCEVEKISKQINVKDEIFLSHGLSISSEGIIRFCYSLNHFSFGFSNYHAFCSNYLKNSDILEFELFTENNFQKFSFNDAIQFMSRTSCKDFVHTSQILKSFLEYQEKTFDIDISQKQIINEMDQRNKQILLCKESIEKNAQKSENKIFQYAIGSLNYQKKDCDIFNIGYSKSYLDLLGIDIENFVRTLLRCQQIDLHQSKEEIMFQSLIGLQTNVFEQFDTDLNFLVTTYDGFPLRIKGKKRNIKLNENSQNQTNLNKQFLLLFTEFDIDVQQLQRLINYRQNLTSKRNDVSYDEFINKELSFMFEDVEYSVHSQSFIEKFYFSNIQNLKYMNEQYLQRQFQIHVKQCGYKQLNNQQQNIL
ncbi:hypothetical protein ABPG74_005363 [Tetrahymena malaccensis]